MAEEILRLGLYDSRSIVELGTFGPGVYIQKMFCEGNSILSTAFLQAKDAGASVLVDYYDYGVGGDVGELVAIGSHNVLNVAGTSDRKLMSRMHNKPVIRWTVTGGNVTFGVYVTVVVTQASDIDNALKYDGQTVDFILDKGIPQVIYDSASGLWEFASGTDGIQDVNVTGAISIIDDGVPTFVDSSGLTTPGTVQTLLSYTVPALKTFNLLSIAVSCRQESTISIFGDSLLIGSGRTGAASPNFIFPYRVARSYVSGKIIEVKATARSGSAVASIESYAQGTLS